VSLPVATSIGANAFAYCASLTTVSLSKAASIGDGTFFYCTSLTTLSLPEAASIGKDVFWQCGNLTTLSLPKVTSIGEGAFGYTGTTSLTITMGAVAPSVGKSLFNSVTGTKTVTVRVPSGATGYGTAPTDTSTNNWGNAFRGKGWNGSSYESGTVNANISLNMQNY
jgi:hypothetical protein